MVDGWPVGVVDVSRFAGGLDRLSVLSSPDRLGPVGHCIAGSSEARSLGLVRAFALLRYLPRDQAASRPVAEIGSAMSEWG